MGKGPPATIGDIIIFTADERNNTFGQIVPKTIVENEQYLLTIVVDEAFLADEKTAYPIRIDPTVEIFYAEENDGDLEDVTVSDTTTYSGTHGSLYIGKKEGAGICRALMKFPIVEDLPDNIIIQSAHIKVRDLMCQGTAMNIECYVFRGNDWSESTATWSNTNAGSSSSIGEHLCTVVMDYDIGVTYLAKHWYTFDITSAVQGWCDGTYSLDAGIIFKMPTADENGSAYHNRTIGSYNRSENQPLGEITYIVDGGIVEVEENSIAILSAGGTSGAVTSWTSSNTDIAEVNQSGVVSGRRAGVTTISAYVGTDLQKTYTVRVVLEDGVYGIGSSIENLYMAVSVMSMADGTTVELKNLQSDMPNKLQQFWKIQYLGGGKYCIRPMHKLNMALSTSSFKVNISDAGTGSSLSLVAAKDQWTITYKNNGYVFMRSGLINYTLTHKEENNKRQVTYAQYVETDPAFYWTITELHFPPSGILFYNKDTYELINEFSSHVVLGKEKTLDQLGIVVAVYSGETNSQEVLWSSSDADIASVQSATGTVSGNASGNVDITACSSAAGASGSYPLLVLTNENSYGFTSYYDKGFHMIDVADITKAVRFVDAAYYKHFGIGFGTEEPIYYGGFLADRCGITTNLPCDERCLSADSGSCCENSHHKNVHRMSEELNNLTRPTKQNVTVLWSNRLQGTYCTDNHVLLDALAIVCQKSGAYYNVILFLRSPAKTMKEHEYAMGLILAHERAHVFGLSDQYIDKEHEQDGWVCVMEVYDGSSLEEVEDFYFNVIWGETDAFCDDCENMLSYIRND